jgi:hypothetical protein
MQPPDDLAPLAVFVVGVVAFIVEHNAPSAARGMPHVLASASSRTTWIGTPPLGPPERFTSAL